MDTTHVYTQLLDKYHLSVHWWLWGVPPSSSDEPTRNPRSMLRSPRLASLLSSSLSVRLSHHLGLLVHTRQPSLAGRDPDLLAVEHKHQQSQVIGREHPTENARNGLDIAQVQNPREQVLTHAERDRLFAQVHRDQHLGQIDRVAVDGVGQGKSEEEVGAPVAHGHAGKVAEPMQVLLRRVGVDDQRHGSDDHGGQEDAQPHLGLSNALVLLGQVCGQSVRRRRERHRQDISHRVAHRDQSRVGL